MSYSEAYEYIEQYDEHLLEVYSNKKRRMWFTEASEDIPTLIQKFSSTKENDDALSAYSAKGKHAPLIAKRIKAVRTANLRRDVRIQYASGQTWVTALTFTRAGIHDTSSNLNMAREIDRELQAQEADS